MSERDEARAFEALPKHARFAEIVSLARAVATGAASSRTLTWKPLADVLPEDVRAALKEEDATTDFGNAWTALERGPQSPLEQALLHALWAHAIAETKAATPEEEDKLVADVVWLAAFTPFDATLLLDRALGDTADAFWPALAERLRKLDSGQVATALRGEALAAASALRASSSPIAAKEVARLSGELKDPAVLALFPAEATPSKLATLRGELDAPPRHPVLTTLAAFTGVLFVSATVRFAMRVAFAYRRPAEVTIDRAGVRVHSTTQVVGRTLREHDVVLPRGGLIRASRETRYARAAFYAGLLSLAIGSLIGVHTFVDGVRAASPSLLFYGLLIVAIGIGLDFLLGNLHLARPGECRVLFESKDGVRTCVRGVDAAAADRALSGLARDAG